VVVELDVYEHERVSRSQTGGGRKRSYRYFRRVAIIEGQKERRENPNPKPCVILRQNPNPKPCVILRHSDTATQRTNSSKQYI